MTKILKQFPGPKLEKHVFAPINNHDTEDDYITSLAEQVQKLHENQYYKIVNKYWPEFKEVPLEIVCAAFDITPPSFVTATMKLEEIRKRLVKESFANEL